MGKAATTCLDDDKDGVIDAAALASVQARADAIVNGYVSKYYSLTAVAASTPEIVKHVALSIAADLAYRRRRDFINGDGKTPAERDYAEAMRLLKEMGEGKFRLDVGGSEDAPVNVKASYRTATYENTDPAKGFVKDGTGVGGF